MNNPTNTHTSDRSLALTEELAAALEGRDAWQAVVDELVTRLLLVRRAREWFVVRGRRPDLGPFDSLWEAATVAATLDEDPR